ncbi:MAG: Ldh family oxidoreductase [Deltaproteobacteria bacterium]|jgi:LDH2 family malate/lactate/ureidoglycolate dehydrogenase|nr:Ldh family oxidoreductase [Deltaproteobacteria bacterium]
MYRLPKETLQNFTEAILIKAGILPPDARTGAAVLLQSDAAGIASHGLSRLPLYMERIELGLVNLRPQIRVLAETPVSMLVDCDNGMGIINVPKIQQMAMDKVQKSGIFAVSMRNSTHYGAGSYYALRALERDLFSMLVTSTTPCVAPTGGTGTLIGTNPLTITVPAGKEKPIVLDMATTTVALGKLQAALREGQKIPLGWALDEAGFPTEDPAQGILGSLLPIGGYKGYGLAVIIDILCAVLSRSSFGNEVGRLLNAPTPKPEDIGHFLLLLDISIFRPLDEFKAEVDRYIQTMKNAPKATGIEEIFLAGEIEFNKMDEYRRDGIPVTEALGEQLLGLARKLNLASAQDDFESAVAAVAKAVEDGTLTH